MTFEGEKHFSKLKLYVIFTSIFPTKWYFIFPLTPIRSVFDLESVLHHHHRPLGTWRRHQNVPRPSRNRRPLPNSSPFITLLLISKTFFFSSLNYQQLSTMAELMFGLGQTKKKKETEQKVRTTKASLKDVTITETVESNVRSDQHGRE